MATRWLDRAIETVSPTWSLRRQRARLASSMLARHYEGAATGRRTQNWYRSTTDANTAAGGLTRARLRDTARDLVRNNPFAESALTTIVDHTVGWGIVATQAERHEGWRRWANSTDCDADGQLDLAGIQKLVMRACVESGEVLIRRRWRRPEDGLSLPLQLQVLEADHLDTSKDGRLLTGNTVVQGVELNAIGRRVAYWLYPSHPGSSTLTSSLLGQSRRVPAEDILHVYRMDRPGQARGVSWFAPVLVRFKDFDEFEDATLMKQKIAACLAVLTTDVDGGTSALGTADDTEAPSIDTLAPGMIANLPAGRNVEVIQPPSVADYPEYSRTSLRAIATGLGVSYEDLTGDYTNLPYSAARMSRLRHLARVNDWHWRILVLQVLNPLWRWAWQASLLTPQTLALSTEWTPPVLPMVDPDKEVLSIIRRIRAGVLTLSEAIRELGYNPETHLAELAADFAKLDELGLTLDIDPRKMTQAGQLQGSAAAKPAPAAAATDDDEEAV